MPEGEVLPAAEEGACFSAFGGGARDAGLGVALEGVVREARWGLEGGSERASDAMDVPV